MTSCVCVRVRVYKNLLGSVRGCVSVHSVVCVQARLEITGCVYRSAITVIEIGQAALCMLRCACVV